MRKSVEVARSNDPAIHLKHFAPKAPKVPKVLHGPDLSDQFRHAADLIDKILRETRNSRGDRDNFIRLRVPANAKPFSLIASDRLKATPVVRPVL